MDNKNTIDIFKTEWNVHNLHIPQFKVLKNSVVANFETTWAYSFVETSRGGGDING